MNSQKQYYIPVREKWTEKIMPIQTQCCGLLIVCIIIFPSAEALVRLRQTDGSLLPPGKFIPVAEDSGLIRSLGLRVLEKVCAFIRQGAASASGLQSIHVNLSAVQLDESRLAAQISSLFSRYSIKPGQINFEITESAKIGKKKKCLQHT